jgi:hypothetical protein
MTNQPSTGASNASAAPQTQASATDAKQILLNDIGKKWDKFSKQDLSALKSNDDLVTQVVAKYGLDKDAAQRDVNTLLKDRTI